MADRVAITVEEANKIAAAGELVMRLREDLKEQLMRFEEQKAAALAEIAQALREHHELIAQAALEHEIDTKQERWEFNTGDMTFVRVK